MEKPVKKGTWDELTELSFVISYKPTNNKTDWEKHKSFMFSSEPKRNSVTYKEQNSDKYQLSI